MRGANHAHMLKCALLDVDPKKDINLRCGFEHLFLQLSAQNRKPFAITHGKPANGGMQILPFHFRCMVHKDHNVWLSVIRISPCELEGRIAYQPAKFDMIW